MAQKIKELRARAMKIHGEAQTLLTEADAEGTTAERAEELRSQFDVAMNDFDKLKRQADDLERLAAAGAAADEMREAQERQGREERRASGARETFVPEGNAADEYREHFREFLASGADLSAISTEAREALRGAKVGVENRAQVTTTGAAGGYTVPSTVATFIIKAMELHGPMMAADWVTILNTSSGAPMIIPGVDDTENEAGDHTEGDEAGEGTDAVILPTELSAYTASTDWLKWSIELAQDSVFSWESILGELIGERLARKINKRLTLGTGANQPLGLVTAAAVGVTAAAADAITADNILELEAEVDPAYRTGPKVGYMMHDKTRLAVRKLKNGNGDYMWREGDLTKGQPATLNGYQARFNQDMAQMAASAKVMTFGNHGKFFSRKVGDPLIGVAREKFFPNLAIAGVHRYDGALGDARAVKALAMPAA